MDLETDKSKLAVKLESQKLFLVRLAKTDGKENYTEMKKYTTTMTFENGCFIRCQCWNSCISRLNTSKITETYTSTKNKPSKMVLPKTLNLCFSSLKCAKPHIAVSKFSWGEPQPPTPALGPHADITEPLLSSLNAKRLVSHRMTTLQSLLHNHIVSPAGDDMAIGLSQFSVKNLNDVCTQPPSGE